MSNVGNLSVQVYFDFYLGWFHFFIQLKYDLSHLMLKYYVFDVDTIYVSHRDFKYLSKIFLLLWALF